MKFIGQVQDGIIIYPEPQERLKSQHLANLKPNTTVQVDITVFRPSKTQRQLGAFWGLAVNTILEHFTGNGIDTSYLLPNCNVPTGIAVSKGLLVEYLYAVCPVFDDNHNRITLSKMNTEQAAKFFDAVRNYSASQWGCYIPEPDPEWRGKKCKANLTV